MKNARNYANDFFFHSCVLIFHFSFMPCRERTRVKVQKRTLLVFGAESHRQFVTICICFIRD